MITRCRRKSLNLPLIEPLTNAAITQTGLIATINLRRELLLLDLLGRRYHVYGRFGQRPDVVSVLLDLRIIPFKHVQEAAGCIVVTVVAIK